MDQNNEIYLGDSVYAKFEEDFMRVYTDNGMGSQNNIYFEIEVAEALVKFMIDKFKIKL